MVQIRTETETNLLFNYRMRRILNGLSNHSGLIRKTDLEGSPESITQVVFHAFSNSYRRYELSKDGIDDRVKDRGDLSSIKILFYIQRDIDWPFKDNFHNSKRIKGDSRFDILMSSSEVTNTFTLREVVSHTRKEENLV
jgi:hypothetical protein